VIVRPELAALLNPVMDGSGTTTDELAFQILVIAAGLSAFSGVNRLRGRAFPRLPRVAGWVLVGLSAVLVVAAIVVPPKLRPQIATNRPRSTARLEILSPSPGQEVSGQLFTVRLDLIGGTITPTTSTTLTSDTGHLHLSVDGSLVSMTFGTVRRIVTANLTPGPHVLEAEFVAADHGPFNPRVTARVTFVKEG
jgi:hypothetical protein